MLWFGEWNSGSSENGIRMFVMVTMADVSDYRVAASAKTMAGAGFDENFLDVWTCLGFS